MIEFSGSSNIQRGWKDHQGLIHNTYHGGNIETGHHVICVIQEDVAKQFAFPNFTTPIEGTLREVLYNDISPRDKISLDGWGITKSKSGGLSIFLKTGL